MVHSMWLWPMTGGLLAAGAATPGVEIDCGGGGGVGDTGENSRTRSTLVYAAKMVDLGA